MREYQVSQRFWGNADNKDVFLFRIENQSGAYIELSNYGATLVSIYTPDKNGDLDNVILGFSSLNDYIDDACYIGATIGPFANRIANSSFKLDGKAYVLESNDGANSNHSGSTGFHKRVFDFEVKDGKVFFYLHDKDGTGGFPGNVDVSVIYHWSENNELTITYSGRTSHKTILNLTNHAYFNLAAGKENILGQELTINSSSLLSVGKDYIPTGEFEAVAAGEVFYKTPIGKRLAVEQGQIKGINSCYVLPQESTSGNAPAAELKDGQSGRIMQLYTSYPGLMLYTGEYLKSIAEGHSGEIYQPFDGVCLEAQYFPDSPNHSGFPSVTLDHGEEYGHYIKLRFNTQI